MYFHKMGGKRIDIVGETFVRLTALSYEGQDKFGRALYLFKCECGIEKVILGAHVRSGHTRSCGCLQRETVRNIGRKKIGDKNPMFGRFRTVEHRRKLGDSLRGRKLSEETKRKIGNANRGRGHTEAAKQKMSIAAKLRTGSKNPNWKGGITSIILAIRMLEKSLEWKYQVFKRDNNTCQHCGEKNNQVLQAHHIVPVSELVRKYNIKEVREALDYTEFFNIDNGITYCKRCHGLLKKKGGLLPRTLEGSGNFK